MSHFFRLQGIKVYWRLQFLEYLRTLSLKFQKARTKIEGVLTLPCWLSQLNWDSQQGTLRTTSILVKAFWNFKLKVLKYSKKCSLQYTLIPWSLKKMWHTLMYCIWIFQVTQILMRLVYLIWAFSDVGIFALIAVQGPLFWLFHLGDLSKPYKTNCLSVLSVLVISLVKKKWSTYFLEALVLQSVDNAKGKIKKSTLNHNLVLTWSIKISLIL